VPSREDQRHSRNSDEIRSSHRIERPQKRSACPWSRVRSR